MPFFSLNDKLSDMPRVKAGERELNNPVDSTRQDSKKEVLMAAKLDSKVKKNKDAFTFTFLSASCSSFPNVTSYSTLTPFNDLSHFQLRDRISIVIKAPHFSFFIYLIFVKAFNLASLKTICYEAKIYFQISYRNAPKSPPEHRTPKQA